jgi:two-component system sensor histidine kinase/response regulator
MKISDLTVEDIPDILIVDDVHANLKILTAILESEGYRVRPVTNGPLALAVAEKEKPSLILLDIMMPAMDGFEVCRLLKANPKLSDVPVIFISALNETKDIVKALTSGGVDYITKPFQAEEVRARVATHLQLYRQKIELKKQSEELHKLNNEKDKFFSIIAHDLRAPFNGFLGLTQILANELPSLTMKELNMIAVSMQKSATNYYSLLENLLEWAKIQRGMIPFDPQLSELLPIVEDGLAAVLESAKNKEIELTWLIPDKLEIFADYHIVQTVIRNLVSNAVKFTPKRGKITLSAKANDDNSIEIAIKDTGIGMNSELIESLFRLDKNTSRNGTEGEVSTGLGLILCKDFIELHNGTISVESEEGKGSSFLFTIPGHAI